MAEMLSRERIARAYAHKEADRVPIFDVPWLTSLARWEREGMPKGAVFHDFFDMDLICKLEMDNSPRFPETVVEETAEYTIRTDKWGSTYRMLKATMSPPEFLDYTIIDEGSWERAKARMTGQKHLLFPKGEKQ